MQLSKEDLLSMYRRMVAIRIFEMSLPRYFEEGYIVGTGHVSMGEEAVAVGACHALEERDYIMSTHRAHGHVLARGADMRVILAEVFGKATGCTGGKGGSMHVSDFERNFLGTSAIVGGGITLAGGVGLAIKMRRSNQVCLDFFGDGASNRGTFHEGLNLAALWKVPTVFLCTNNQYAMTLPQSKGCANLDISARAAAYNMPGYRIDGTDVIAVYETVKAAVDRARRGEGPSLIECITYRLSPEHSLRVATVAGTEYRPKGELEEWWQKYDPVKIFREKLIATGYLTEEGAKQIEAEAQREFEEAVDFAISSPEPSPETAFEDIYAPEGGD
ncbi:MAG TPA: thiamine pyrophosphate-dependent dehydrogenase E1 component subunit alpha [Dehalococcoidia bacterium]|nr:thiamine pyrophosphate-dependent dehydrogenase E1 component subunit alpha [Dehalococcoidia bacterium]